MEEITINEQSVQRALAEWHRRASELSLGQRQERQREADSATPEDWARALAPWIFSLLKRNAP
jgi:hypothetical protein